MISKHNSVTASH